MVCSDCDVGYFLQENGICTLCNSFISNCVSCNYYNKQVYCLSCFDENNKYKLLPSADLKSCLSCQHISDNFNGSNCLDCSLRNENGQKLDYLNQAYLLYHSQFNEKQINDEINKYQFQCDQCIQNYFLNTQYQCLECMTNCEICYQGDETESILNQDGYFTLQYKYAKKQQSNFKKKCLKCKEGFYLLKTNDQTDEQCLNINGLTNDQKISNCLNIVLQGTITSCRFCYNSGQIIGENKCDISLDEYKKDEKCISFYKTKEKDSYFCDLCQEGYVPTPLGCVECKKSQVCSQISIIARKSFLFSPIYLQLFKSTFTSCKSQKYYYFLIYIKQFTHSFFILILDEEQNYFSIYQILENPVHIRCLNGANPIDGMCQISQCSESSCYQCESNILGQEYCKSCRDSDPNKNLYYDQIFKPSMIPRRRVLSMDQEQCISCDRYCDSCVKRSEEEVKKLNPYFIYNFKHSKQLTEYYTSFTTKCIKSRQIQDQCQTDSITKKEQITQSIKCDDNLNHLSVYYHSLFNRFTVCKSGSSSCKKSIKFAKVIDCSLNPKYIKLSDVYKEEQFIADPYVYKIQTSQRSDQSLKFVLDFLEYENILYANNVFNEELITNYEYVLYIIPDQFNSCSIQNDFTIKSTIASKVFAIETISLTLIPLIQGKPQTDMTITLKMSQNVNIQGFNLIKLNQLQIMDLLPFDNQLNQSFGINLNQNLLSSEVILTNITFLKNQEIDFTSTQKARLSVQNIFFRLKKITMNNVRLENLDFTNGLNPFVFLYEQDLQTSQEIQFIGDINELYLINLTFKNIVLFPIFNPSTNLTINQCTLEKVKFFNSTLSHDFRVSINDQNQNILLKINKFKFTECLIDSSSFFQLTNINSKLIIEGLDIDQTNKFKNGQEINLISARSANIQQIKTGCIECQEDVYLDLNYYNLFNIPELSTTQKKIDNLKNSFVIEDFHAQNCIFRQKSFAIYFAITSTKSSYSITLSSISFTNIQCRGLFCQEGLNAIYLSGVQLARINDISIINSNRFQLLQVLDSLIIEINGLTCSNQDLEDTVSSTCLILNNYLLYAQISSVSISYLQTFGLVNIFFFFYFVLLTNLLQNQPFIQVGQENLSKIPYKAKEIVSLLQENKIIKDIINQYFEGLLETSPILIMKSIEISEIYQYPKKEGQVAGAIMIQNNIENRSFIQQMSITNTYVVKEETDIQELVAGLYYTSTNDILILESFSINGIDTEYCKMVNYISSNKIRILNGIFKDSNSLKFETIVIGGFFNILTQDLLVQSSMFFAGKSYYGAALYISNNQKAQVRILGPKTYFFSTMSVQQGGGIYIDSFNDIDILISQVTVQSLLALSSGGFFFMKSDKLTSLTIEKSTFKDCFCEQGSIINIDSNSIHSEISIIFDSNTYTSPRTYEHYTEFVNDIKQGAMFYLLKANLTLSNNVFQSIYINSPLVYLFSGNYVEFNNTYRDISQENPPFIFLQKTSVKINELQDTTKNNIYENIRIICLNLKKCTEISKISYIYSIDGPISPPEMHNMNFNSIICSSCGLIYNEKLSNENKMLITNSKFFNNTLFLSPIVFVDIQVKSRLLLSNQLQIRQLEKKNKELVYLDKDLEIYDLKLFNCQFIKNKVQSNGGALSLQEINFKIEDFICQQNESKEQGGCIYYFSQQTQFKKIFMLIRSKIQENNAKIGGGIRVIGTEAIQKENTEINNNSVTLYGQDYLSYPMGISISHYFNGIKTHLANTFGNNTILFNNWNTGDTEINNGYFIIEFLDINQQIMVTPEASIDIQLNDDELNDSASKIEGIKKFSFDIKTNSVQLKDVIFKKRPLQDLSIKVTSNSIKYSVYDSQTGFLLDYNTNFYFILKIQMRECLVGEAFFDMSGECRMCDQNYYSLHKSSTKCIECPSTGVESCDGGDKIKVASGWWRPTPQSDIITECRDYKSGCLGGYSTGNQSCKVGYIGALCQSCDIYGKVWGEKYSKNSLYTCKSCNLFSNNATRLAMLGLFVSASLFLSIRSQIKSIRLFKYKYYLIKMGILKPGKSFLSENQVTIVIKILTTYMQIIYHLSRFEIQLPTGLDELTQLIGNPIRQVSQSLDCQIVEHSQNIPIVYTRVIWKLSQPILLFLISIAIYGLVCLVTRTALKKVVLYTITLYTVIYTQPSIVQELISCMACFEVSGQYFIASDYNYQCYNEEYYKWTFPLVLPAFIFWCFIIPIILFLKLKLNSHLLSTPKFKEKFGFIYNEYRKQVYFWELLKISVKVIIVVVIEFYSSYIYIKGILLILICFIYSILARKFKPYYDMNINMLDKSSFNACLISIILVVFNYKNPFVYFQYITFILLIIVNVRFILKILINLLREYTIKFSIRIDKYRLILHSLFPRLSKALKISSVTLARKQYLWSVFRCEVDKFVKQLKTDRLNMIQNDSLSTSHKKFSQFDTQNKFESTPSTMNRLKSLRSKTALEFKPSAKMSVQNNNNNISKKEILIFQDQQNHEMNDQEIEISPCSSNREIPNENINVQQIKLQGGILNVNSIQKFNNIQTNQKPSHFYQFQSPKQSLFINLQNNQQNNHQN